MADVISWLLGKGVNVIVTSSPDKREIENQKILSLVGYTAISHQPSAN